MTPAYRTELGRAHCGDARQLLRHVQSGSVSLVFTSPPFPLRRRKAYGNVDADGYIDWLWPVVEEVHRVLRHDGSFVMELGGGWNPGSATRSLMPYELLLHLGRSFHLAQDFYWWNTRRLPGPTQYVCKERSRCKEAVTWIWWLSKSTRPQADNRAVVQPYARPVGGFGPGLRPSGHAITPATWQRDNGGAIPPNVFALPGVAGDDFQRRCEAAGLVVHPARMPAELPEFFIRFLTRPGQLVCDPFAGSNTTGHAAERLGRRWLSIEVHEPYVEASRLRWSNEKAAPQADRLNH